MKSGSRTPEVLKPFDMVKQYNLRGVSYWALGYPHPQN